MKVHTHEALFCDWCGKLLGPHIFFLPLNNETNMYHEDCKKLAEEVFKDQIPPLYA
jgi:hypothetical protein